MAEDLVELGIEGFDRLVDRYHDTAHDHAIQYGRKIPRPKRWRKNALGQEVAVEEPQPQPQPEVQRASSETRADPSQKLRPRRGENDPRESEDQGYASERPRRRPRRYSGNQSRGEIANDAPPRKLVPGEPPRDHRHIYPPPPGQDMSYEYQQMQQMQPYQPNAAPFAAAAGYESGQQRSRSSRPPEDRRRRDYDRKASPPRRRKSERDGHRKKPSHNNDSSLGASLAGALAGGLIGHQAGKGDVFSTAAGAIVGAFGGSIAAEKHAQNKEKRRYDDY